MQEGQWEIFHYDHSNFYRECICGHRVKRVTYLYDRISKKIMHIGTTCVKKYGISNHLKNRILIQVLKENMMKLETYSLEEKVASWIQKSYSIFRNKINECSEGEFDYYDIVAPFRRLLNDVCELVTEYKFDLISLLKEIERDVDSMNAYTKHHMIDESDESSSISTIDTEIYSQNSDILPLSDELCNHIDHENSSVISFVNSEFSVESVEDIVSVISFANSEFSVEMDESSTPLPVAIADPFCTDPNCSPELHGYCQLKRRLEKMKNGIVEHRLHIQSIRMELEDCLKISREIQEDMRKQRDYSENFIINYRRDLLNIYRPNAKTSSIEY
ncbi:hypothetical protein EBS02_07870 [bacterium]|nr:hypothetical protein [bacterium]